ncbi:MULTISPECIES: phosphogluconate dehydratase [Marivita]|uniref:Phosphogluconate dehydratase n=1 Tax=Marivita cryptomonadis TaxID=505252 RepID=A0A9Q2P5R9_9RHOB|nr:MULTISPECIES: phosphogluconate dehydratase [Marivita]MCR9167842.1 phosphogluconate dehydratase [Paracoccaceae bacterium]MBM2322785.1 phosphogluconate dehydratase [Marivita cryptomonadis]MBM2332367.1 phosphogluconate dehydratase [Marivita cryptomonadis]MBM2341951.1 phosphogluconate dehydratase [Marivita cryptomonadis]MBM2346615.1 phosphogluconate dehydratase [Marivita cryptomonadis]
MAHSLNDTIKRVTERVQERSETTRGRYMERMRQAAAEGPRRAHLSCGNQAHAYAAMGQDQDTLATERSPNIGIVTAYNDMLSAHQPFERYPDIIREAARAAGGTAQVAGGVPAMCDGVTQGQVGMELSLFSRDVIALAAGVALSHNTFDSALYLGVCDKIVPGLVIAAGTFGYLPGIFIPAGPMPSGLPNDEKAKVRQKFAAGEVGRDELMKAEMASYHSPGTCTFYGTANSNQMLMEFMGLHLPGSSFVNPGTPLREALTVAGTERALEITQLGNDYRPVCDVLDEKAFVNGIVGLMATGGSTNLVLHLPAMARAAGVELRLEDFEDISSVTPLMAKVYPNGLADVNHFHAAGGLGFMIGELLKTGLLHEDVKTVAGDGLHLYSQEPKIADGRVVYGPGAGETQNDRILRPASDPFQPTGGLKQLAGNLGKGMMKTSAVAPERHVIEAKARVFHDQEDVKTAFKNGEFTEDTIVVVRFQGPSSNGMPELHSLTPTLSVLQDRGLKVALVTDGRMSGASGKVPSAIHVSPEAAKGGPLARVRDGDLLRVDAVSGKIDCLAADFAQREPVTADLSGNGHGVGRELFAAFRANVGLAEYGAGVVV